MERRVFVIGAGIISAIGVGKDATIQSIMAGETGIMPVKHLVTDHSYLPVGEVKMSNAEMSQALAVKYPCNELRTVLLGMYAAKEAVEEANLTATELKSAAFIGGTTVGGMDKTERHFKKVMDTQAEAPDSGELKYNDCGYSTDFIADYIGKFKIVTTSSTACSSAANAIIMGANLIKAGIVDIAVVGGSEALSKFHLNGFNTLMILDKERCRPFDKGRTGINLGEGAAFLVLESQESAVKRGAKVLAELKGYGNSCDAFHQTATSENGEGAYLAMRKAMDMAHLNPSDINYVNAHGTGTPNNDECEVAAMERIWGCSLPFFSSTKSFTGHTTSASGSIEAVISILCMEKGIIPLNLGFTTPIKEGATPVQKTQSERTIKNVLNNSFGFGGNDSSLIFSKYEESHG